MPVPKPGGRAAAAKAPPAGLGNVPAEKSSSTRTGRIVGNVFFPTRDRTHKVFSYQIYVFSAGGTMDGPRPFANSTRFELRNVPPGRYAVFFFSPTEVLTCPYQIATVPEGGESEVEFHPRSCHSLAGKVVDANGAPVGGVYVMAAETIPLPQELYLEGRPSAIEDLETAVNTTGVTSPVGSNPAEVPTSILKIQPGEGRISRGVITDAQGKFSVPLSSADIPVPLTVLRSAAEVLKEEIVLPSAGFARIVLPNQ